METITDKNRIKEIMLHPENKERSQKFLEQNNGNYPDWIMACDNVIICYGIDG